MNELRLEGNINDLLERSWVDTSIAFKLTESFFITSIGRATWFLCYKPEK